MSDDKEGREERARRLRERIEGLRSGGAEGTEPRSPREFLDEEADREMRRESTSESDRRAGPD